MPDNGVKPSTFRTRLLGVAAAIAERSRQIAERERFFIRRSGLEAELQQLMDAHDALMARLKQVEKVGDPPGVNGAGS